MVLGRGSDPSGTESWVAHQWATGPAEVLAKAEGQGEQVVEEGGDEYILQPKNCCGML